MTFLTPWDPDSCCSTRPSGLKALDTGWNDETRVSVVIIVSAEIGMPLLLLSIFIMILCNIVLSELWVLPVSSEAESSSLGTSEHKVRFNHLTLQEERLWVWDENYIDTQLHYNNQNNITVKTSSLGYNNSVNLGVICNVNVAGGVVLSTSLCQHRGGKGPCANTDNVEQCL